jgi:protein TonB
MSVTLTAPPAPALPPVAPPPDPVRKPPAPAPPPPVVAPRIIATPANPVVPVAFTVPVPAPIFAAKAPLPVADSGLAEIPASTSSAVRLAASTSHIGSGPGSTNGVAQAVAITRAHPDYDHNPPPSYPPVARLRGWHGTVILSVEVNADGSAGEVGVVKSSGHPPLDEASTEAVRAWRFHPARVGDIPVRSRVEVPISFRLKKG